MICFQVEHSLESGFVKGMKVEVPVKGTEPTSYWMASIVMSCGQLLRLRYDGYHINSSADFWCDVKSQEVHPVGWCQKNGKTMQPPSGELRVAMVTFTKFGITSL